MAAASLQLDLRIQALRANLEQHVSRYGPFHPIAVAAANQLAIAYWAAGDVQQAVGILDQALEDLARSEYRDHSVRTDVLCTLGEIFVEQSLWQPARDVFREVIDCCTRCSGPNHPSVLAAKGDLAIALFELGESTEAKELERQAARDAREHLGPNHPVACVLAWNRALRQHQDGNSNAARRVLADELAWLLTVDESALNEDQKTIRGLVAEQFQWERASVC